MSHGAVVLAARDLVRAYPVAGQSVRAVKGISLQVEQGEWVAIVGPSGCGKSTLLNLLGAIDQPTSGEIRIAGRDVAALKDRDATRFRLMEIGFVFQRFYLMPTLTAAENIELPMSEAGLDKVERRLRVKELLGYVGLAGRGDHRPHQLSGGEQQRVAIARALANRPSLILADEPTGELDAATGTEMVRLFDRLNLDGVTIVVVTHDEELAQAARRVVHVRDGLIVDDRVVRPLEPSA